MQNQSLFSEEKTLLITTVPQLEQAFRSVLSELLDSREEESKDRRITRKETCKRLGKDVSTIRRWEKQHMLHPIYIGKCVCYAESEIKAIEEGIR